MELLHFEWDENKNEINKRKHGISFETAKEVFYDDLAIVFDDPDHSVDEDRFLIIGMTKSSKVCIVSHCYRDNDNIIRIISAREATKREKNFYEEGVL
ncbi:MAG: BrnT family toxin [Ruminococcus sp.]|nr:BrnT family toxin [Ruminococcus sp.]